MNIGIGFPAYISNDAHYDYAIKTLNSIVSEKHKLKFLCHVNYVSKDRYVYGLQELGVIIEHNPTNNVSMAWNRSILELLELGCEYVIVPNLDLILKYSCVDNLVQFAVDYPEYILWTATAWNEEKTIQEAPEDPVVIPHPHFSLFMVDGKLFERVGQFDENFSPAYNEDLDMHWRITLEGEYAAATGTAKFYHYGSRTIFSDSNLRNQNFRTHSANDAYFVRKWGHKPETIDAPFTKGMYRTPFGPD